MVAVLHNDNYTTVAKNGFDPGSASKATSLESQLSFIHIKNALSQKEMLHQVHLAICENRRQVLLSRLEAIAGTDNPYSLTNVISRGVKLTRVGSVVYTTHCNPVQVGPGRYPLGTAPMRSPSATTEQTSLWTPSTGSSSPLGPQFIAQMWLHCIF